MKKKAFTLAEVLITLGIIGVVAALTIPTLMQKYRKNVIETRLKQANSMLINAAKLSEVDYGLNHVREDFVAKDPDVALEMFNKYYAPYIKFVGVKKGDEGVFGELANGSELYFYRERQCDENEWSCTYLYFCEDHKSCEEIEDIDGAGKKANNKTSFVLGAKGTPINYAYAVYNRTQWLQKCTNGEGESCIALLIDNGWHFPDDYPFKF